MTNEELEMKYLELKHFEIGFLTGILEAVKCGADVKGVIKKRIEDLRSESE